MIKKITSTTGPEIALSKWEKNCADWFEERLPYISFRFDSSLAWNIDKEYGSKIAFGHIISDLQDKDDTFIRALRCAIVECWRAPRSRFVRGAKPYPRGLAISMQSCLREFKTLNVSSIYHLSPKDFDQIQKQLVTKGTFSQKSVLDSLEKFARFLREADVCPSLMWVKSKVDSDLLLSSRTSAGKRVGDPVFNSDLGETDGDRRIGALMELAHLTLNRDEDLATNERQSLAKLTRMDHICIYSMLVLMCAPARINEILSMGVDDIKTFQSFAEWEKPPAGHDPASRDKFDTRYRGHQSLFYRDIKMVDLDEYSRTVLLQKGSKGGKWAPKPVLIWMQAVLQECVTRIEENSRRSRKLASHYKISPDVLYLPTWAEYLREKHWWTHNEILGVWGDLPEKPSDLIPCKDVFPGFHPGSVNLYLKTGQVEKRLWNECPKKGVKPFVFNGKEVTALMLKSVKQSLEKARQVTSVNVVSCDVSERLFLTDCSAVMPFTVGAIDYQALGQRFGSDGKFSVFKKLGIRIYQKNNLVNAFIGTHDVRHFICDHATKSGLSDVLVNKWCRRADIRQMDYYQQYDPLGRAKEAGINGSSFLDQNHVTQEVSANIQRREELKIENARTMWLTIGDKKIQSASLDQIIQAGSSPILARTINGEPSMLTPVLTGICSHQHHIAPCQNYDVFCLGCSDHTLVKGHLPTNEVALNIRSVQRKLLIDYIEEIIPRLNGDTFEHSDAMISHLEKVFELQISMRSLSAEALADELIERIDEDILGRIQSTALRDLLRKAFVSGNIGNFIDDQNVGAGSTITYNSGIHSGKMNLSLIHQEMDTESEISTIKERIELEFGKGCVDELVNKRLIGTQYEPESDEVS